MRLTGVGCSLIFPSMGREVVHLVDPRLKGAALGGYAMFQDLAYALTGRAAGFLAAHYSYRGTFLAGATAAAVGLLVATGLRRQVALAGRVATLVVVREGGAEQQRARLPRPIAYTNADACSICFNDPSASTVTKGGHLLPMTAMSLGGGRCWGEGAGSARFGIAVQPATQSTGYDTFLRPILLSYDSWHSHGRQT
ncbi:MFS transporter [Luteibacter yeojuensis]|uniref:MFS transporter n=1 Tax=Luteibacter yeojuensis TaxID=345309 RepID=UPI003D18C865